MTAQNHFDTTAVICAHRVVIRYWDFDTELTDELKERLTEEGERRAKACITEGYVSGELNCLNPETEEEIYGWWEIEDCTVT